MKKVEDVAVIIQARLSSQRCPQKMIRPFANTTLMDIALQKLQDSKIPNENVWCSVYEPELKELCSKYPFNVYERTEKSALSEGTPMTEMYEWWDKLPHKYVVMVNACAPMLTKETIENFYFDYCKSEKAGMFAVMDKKNYFWDEDGTILTPLKEDVMNTKTAKIIKEAAHCLYAGSLEKVGQGVWMGDFNKPNDIELWSMAERESLDIDYEWQFNMCESLYKMRNK